MSIRSEWNRAKSDYYGPESRATDATLQKTLTPAASNLEPWQYAAVGHPGSFDHYELTGFGGIVWGQHLEVESVTVMNPNVPDALDIAAEAAREGGRDIPKYTQLALVSCLTVDFGAWLATAFADGATGSSVLTWTLGVAAALVTVGIPALYVGWRRRVRRMLRRGRKANAFVTVSGAVAEGTSPRMSAAWLTSAQRIAKLCGEDDKVAELCGSALRDILWAGRRDLGEPEVQEALTSLRKEAEKFATARRELEQTLRADADTSSDDKATRLAALTAEAADRAAVIRAETRIAADVRNDMLTKYATAAVGR
jgi:hypothetical protein